MNYMMPNIKTFSEFYTRLHSNVKAIKKSTLVKMLKRPHMWLNYCQQRYEREEQELCNFIYKLENNLLEELK